jgi:predicted amidohydrolase
MNIALIQAKIEWENPGKNFARFEEMINRVGRNVNVVVLPEAFTTGFTMNQKKLYRLASYPVLDWLQEKAFEKQKTIVAGAFVKENDRLYNRLFWVNPDGSYYYYDKRHLFSIAGENDIFTPGNRRVIVNHGALKFNLQICYDLRFPVWSANTFDKKTKTYLYDVLIYVANWPQKRKDAYLPLLRSRAIENQAYVIWVNRVGRDATKTIFSGDTRIIDPGGKTVAIVKTHTEGIVEYRLSKQLLEDYRNEFPVAWDWDNYEIRY